MSSHARFSMSKLPRIIDCPGSHGMCLDFFAEFGEPEEKTEGAAADGTYLHSITADHLTRDVYKVTDILHADRGTNIDFTSWVNDALSWAYSMRLLYPDATWFIETRVSCKGYIDTFDIDLLDECEGTCDLYIIDDTDLHVVDWKYGAIEVEASSDQLMGYAAGVLKSIKHAEKFKKVHLHIFQPRSAPQHKTITVTVQDVIRWVQYNLAPALMATKANPYILNPTEKACMFCPAKTRCKARHQHKAKVATDLFAAYADAKTNPLFISNGDLSEALKQIPFIESCIRDLLKLAYKEVISGRPVPGRKLVAGRTSRKFKDNVSLINFVESNGFDLSDISEVSLLGVAKVEKVIGRKLAKLPEFTELFVKIPGNPILVDESDNRPEVQIKSAEEVFAHLTDDEDYKSDDNE